MTVFSFSSVTFLSILSLLNQNAHAAENGLRRSLQGFNGGPIIPDGTLLIGPNGGTGCPSVQPQTGSGCGGWVPAGHATATCLYEDADVSCGCNQSSTRINWTCRRGNTIIAAPITVQLNSVVTSPGPAPTLAPVTTTSGVIELNINNPPSCPTGRIPNTGEACAWQSECGYQIGTRITNCQCGLASETALYSPASRNAFVCSDATKADEVYLPSSSF